MYVLLVVILELHAVFRLSGVVEIQVVNESTFLVAQCFIRFIQGPDVIKKLLENLKRVLLTTFVRVVLSCQQPKAFLYLFVISLPFIN